MISDIYKIQNDNENTFLTTYYTKLYFSDKIMSKSKKKLRVDY